MDEAAIRKRIERWKTQLLDLTFRNRLLNFREGPKTLKLEGCAPAALEDALASGKRIRFVPAESKGAKGQGLDNQARDLADGQLRVACDEKVLTAKLRTIAKDSRLAQEEMGVDTLHLAIGMLSYYEDDRSNQPRTAPLLLVPVSLAAKRLGGTFELSASGEDTVFNVTLLEKLKREHGIAIPELLDELPRDDAGVDVPRVLELVRAAVQKLDRAQVLLEAHLAHFSFTKFLMWRDLERNSDLLLSAPLVRQLAAGRIQNPGDPLPEDVTMDDDFPPDKLHCIYDADSSQMAALAAAARGRSFVLQGPPGTGKSQTITNLIAHAICHGKTVLFVAEKRAALEVVQNRLERAGLGDFCLDLHLQKASPTAALQQLERTLKMDKPTGDGGWAQVAEQVGKLRGQLNSHVRELHRLRPNGFTPFQALSELVGNRHAATVALRFQPAVDRKRLAELEETVEQLVGRLAAVGDPARHPMRHCNVREWSPQLEETANDAAKRMRRHVEGVHRKASDLARALSVSAPTSVQGMEELVRFAEFLGTTRPMGVRLAVGEGDAVSELDGVVPLAERRASHYAHVASRYAMDRLAHVDLHASLEKLERWASAFFLFAWIALWGLRKQLAAVCTLPQLPSHTTLRDDLRRARAMHEDAAALEAQTAALEALLGPGTRQRIFDPPELTATKRQAQKLKDMTGRVGARWKADDAIVSDISSEAWPRRRQELIQASADLTSELVGFREARAGLVKALGIDANFEWPSDETPTGLTDACAIADTWAAHAGIELRDWARLQNRVDLLRQEGLEELHEHHKARRLTAQELVPALRRAYHLWWLQRDDVGRALLSDFRGSEHAQRVSRFMTTDKKLVETTRAAVRAKVAALVPSASASASSEVGVILHEAKKKRGHMPIRKLLGQAPKAVRKIKPCVMMSPLSVTQYLDIRSEPFDLVVFDEASQVPVHDAIGALARAKQLIVVGDSKQLPPTNFFAKQLDDEPDEQEESGSEGATFSAAIEDAESILEEFQAAGLSQLSLRWHYRSQHESLIAFSNHFYYDGNLLTFPSAVDNREKVGVSLRRVNGTYDAGKSRTNRVEAEALVAELVRRLRDREQSRYSIGVVTFSKAQQDLIETLIEEACQRYPDIVDHFSTAKTEAVFVKNLENVQGDERDVILFSVCYGRDAAGKMAGLAQSPLGKEGGHRRLNVAITRARRQLVVFSSVGAEAIDDGKSKARAIHEVKVFLDYAERGVKALHAEIKAQEELSFDSPFEIEVYQELRGLGHDVRTQVGCAGYRIDLAIMDPNNPGRYLLGIECDGASYHSGKTARDRDRLRAGVLEGLGWKLHRIWSTDWWMNPRAEVERIRARVQELLSAPPSMSTSHVVEEPVFSPAPVVIEPAQVPERAPSNHNSAAVLGETYAICALTSQNVDSTVFYDANYCALIIDDIKAVVDREAPIALPVLARRVLQAWGLVRVTAKASARVQELMAPLVRDGVVVDRDGWVWLRAQDPRTFDSFRPLTEGDGRDIDDVPLEELASAARAVLRRDLSLPRAQLAVEVGRVMGLERVRAKALARCERAVELILASGHCTADEERVALA